MPASTRSPTTRTATPPPDQVAAAARFLQVRGNVPAAPVVKTSGGSRAGGEVVASVQPALGVSLSLVVRAPDLGAVEASVRSALGVTP